MLKKVLGLLIGVMLTVSVAMAAKVPEDVQGYLKKNIEGVDIRFDGVITTPDGAIYLPLFPASFKKPDVIEILETYPAGADLSSRPEAIIFNNDFVLLKVITDENGKKTVKRFDKPPVQVKTGILPQDIYQSHVPGATLSRNWVLHQQGYKFSLS